MRRRNWLILAALAGVAAALPRPQAALAQPGAKPVRVGVMVDRSWSAAEGMRGGFRALGYVEGETLLLEYRWAGGGEAHQLASARELVALGVDAIITYGTAATLAAQQATLTVPIVAAAVSDASIALFANEVARPGRNVTGFSSVSQALHLKRLELLNDLLPGLARVVYLANLENPTAAFSRRAVPAAAAQLGIAVEFVETDFPALDAVARRLAELRPDSVLVPADPDMLAHGARIVRIMAQSRLPAIYSHRALVEAGGLISYDAGYRELFRRAAQYVDKILKGARPGELPFQQAERFELTLNVATARALGLAVPPLILERADEVIE
jgi:putative tryptophan/tyrosine transport system substrate-binding protein